MKWISVEDKMPPANEHIIVFDDGVGTAFFLEKDLICIATGSPFWDSLTHWMPLPSPPENE